MKKKLKRYKISKESETYAISLVDYPAIEVDWVYMAKQTPLVFKNDEKHLIIGPALIPNKPIYRIYDDEEFEVVFEGDVIEKMAYEFMSKERTKSITLDHLDFANDIAVVESWIKMSENDKSNDLGFNLPIGTWFISMKVNDKETWDRIKNGELNGFSIESLVSLEEYEFNKINKTDKYMIQEVLNEESLLDKIKAIINDALGKSEDEPKEDVVEDAAQEVIDEVKDEDIEKKDEEMVEEPVVDEPSGEEVKTAEEIVEDVVETVEETVEEPEQVENELQTIIDGLNEQIDELNKEIAELKEENEKLGKKPSANPIHMHSEKRNAMEIIESLRNGTYFKK